MQHIYNVMEPLAADEPSKQILSAFEQTDFDSNILQTGQCVTLNLIKVNSDFRINERIFRDQLASRPDLEL